MLRSAFNQFDIYPFETVMPTLAPPDDYLLPEAVYPLRKFLKIAGISQTTLWRIEHVEKITLPRIKAKQKVYVEGRDGIEFLKERDRRQAGQG